MPYLVQTLHASSISAQYRPLEEMLEFTIHASISKGEAHMQYFVTDILYTHKPLY